jgi:hypothetical protein
MKQLGTKTSLLNQRKDKKVKIWGNHLGVFIINVLLILAVLEPGCLALDVVRKQSLKYVNKIARSRFYVFSLLCTDNAAVILRVFVCLMCYLKHFYVLTSIGILYDNNQASFLERLLKAKVNKS